MMALSDVFLVLPGGLGTLDETLDVIANNRMNFINKKIAIFNCHHFFDGLISLIDKMIALNFLSEKIKDELIIESDIEVVFERLGV